MSVSCMWTVFDFFELLIKCFSYFCFRMPSCLLYSLSYDNIWVQNYSIGVRLVNCYSCTHITLVKVFILAWS